MEHLVKITLFGMVSGIIGTGIGGFIAFFIGSATNRFLGFILEFSAGIMISVVCFELIPEAFVLGGVLPAFIGIILGVVAILLIEEFINKTNLSVGRYTNNKMLRAGILMAVGIALHNFPEGFAVGSAFKASETLGITITSVIIIHDIPEGIAMAVPMRIGGLSKIKSFVFTLLSGVPMGIGALLGAVLGNVSKEMISVCLGFAGGAMLYIVLGEMIPESKRIYLGRLSSIGNIIGIICGIIISRYNK
jgi:ZIP family zinc transporter